LIIDQPEDHLDNLYIYSNLVSSLRLLKGYRQLIIVTHNPNLVVASDAEQVICLDSDDTRGWISAVGSIDRDKIQEFVLRCLEGGKEALVMRLKKYGISLEQQ
jgi:predicted ATP-dependent endonuclease of OLD family